MSTFLFVAEVTGAPPAYRAAFPDLPGLVVEALDLPQMLVSARMEVQRYLQALSDKGEVWPDLTPIHQICAIKGAFLILVDVAVDDPPVRVNLSIGERLLERLDAEASRRSMTRSGFIAHAVRVSLGERSGARDDVGDLGRKLQDELSALGQRINESVGPDSAFSQRMIELDALLYDGVKKAADGVSAAMTRRRQNLKRSQDAAAFEPLNDGADQ